MYTIKENFYTMEEQYMSNNNSKENHKLIALCDNNKDNEKIYQDNFGKELPSLYRYVKWNINTIDCISRKHFFIAPAEKMNDLAEFYQVSVLDNDLYGDISDGLPKGTKIKLEVDDIEETYESQIDMISKIEEDNNKSDRQNMGIISFTNNNQNAMMWNFYADKYRGICLEFKPEIIYDFNKGIFGKVEYGEFPRKTLIENAFDPLNKFLYKSTVWEQESEYRYVKYLTDGKKYLEFDASNLKAVYCGYKMNEAIRDQVHFFVKNANPNAVVYEANVKTDDYGFIFAEYNPR